MTCHSGRHPSTGTCGTLQSCQRMSLENESFVNSPRRRGLTQVRGAGVHTQELYKLEKVRVLKCPCASLALSAMPPVASEVPPL